MQELEPGAIWLDGWRASPDTCILAPSSDCWEGANRYVSLWLAETEPTGHNCLVPTSLAFFFRHNFNFLYLSNCTLCCLLTGDNQRDSNSPIWSLGQQPWGQTPFHHPQTLQFAPHLWALFLLWHGDMPEESFHNLRQWVSGLHLCTLFLSKFTWRRLQHRFSLWLRLTYFWE